MTAFQEKLIEQLETLPERMADAMGEIAIEESAIADAWHDKYEEDK